MGHGYINYGYLGVRCLKLLRGDNTRAANIPCEAGPSGPFLSFALDRSPAHRIIRHAALGQHLQDGDYFE